MKYRYVGELVIRKYIEVEAEDYSQARSLIQAAPESEWETDDRFELYVSKYYDEEEEENQ